MEDKKVTTFRWEVAEARSEAVCQQCDDYGMVYDDVPVGHPRFGKLFPCPYCEKGAAMKRDRMARAVKNSGLPAEYARLTFDTFSKLSIDERRLKNHAAGAAYLFASGGGQPFTLKDAAAVMGVDKEFEHDAPRSWLVLTGEPGMGKTGLASAVVNHLSMQRIPVLFVRVRELIRNVQESYGDGSGERADSLQQLVQTVDYLVLDEFNLPNMKPDRLEIMEAVIRGRYANRLPTMATTNWTQEEFASNWGVWVGDIMAMAHWLKMGGVKLRHTSAGEVESF